jgi:hypothetical protein
MPRATLLPVSCWLVPHCGCRRVDSSLATEIIGELGNQANVLFVSALKWAALGMGGGLVLAVVAFWLLKRLGAYRWEWRYAGWFRALTCAAMVVICPILGGVAGVAEGVPRGSERVLRRGPLATDLLPAVGAACADVTLVVHVAARTVSAGERVGWRERLGSKWQLPRRELERFRKGEEELNVTQFIEQLDRGAAHLSDFTTATLKEEIAARYAGLRGGTGEKLIGFIVPKVMDRLVRRELRDRTEHYGADQFLNVLKADAARQGDPQTISYEQLGATFVEHLVVPALLTPIRVTARETEASMLVIGLIVVLLPVAVFRVAERIRRRGQSAAPRDAMPATHADGSPV